MSIEPNQQLTFAQTEHEKLKNNTYKCIEDAESNDELLQIAYTLLPYRDGSAREVLPSKKWSNNLKASAPWIMRKTYALAKSGFKGTPLNLILKAPTAETQYALLMDWYKMLHIDRPTIQQHRRFSLEEYDRIRSLREEGLSHKQIGEIVGRNPHCIGGICSDIKIKTEKTKLNAISLELYGYHFSTLRKGRQTVVRAMLNP
ncbi:MAG TPA: hypothetical protein VJ184_06095 [Chryseolinea sp.]|nr:hypothetical protein [Chryseolinea sp.]